MKRLLGIFCAILLVFSLAGCGTADKGATPTGATQVITDSIGRQVTIPKEVHRVAVANAYNTEIINAWVSLIE